MFVRARSLLAAAALAAACSSPSSPSSPSSTDDGGGGGGDAGAGDASDDGVSPGDGAQGTDGGALGKVTNVSDTACPSGAPPGSTCKTISVGGCPGIAGETIGATVAILAAQGSAKGTVVHFSGGGGQGFESTGTQQYAAAGLLQVFVSWASAWEQTASAGIKAGACRPATVLQWVFAEPGLHAASRTSGFCAQGFSGGSGQLGYALAQYGMGDYLDYVNELSGPPFARIDLGCDGNAPATATVCGASDTMRLPPFLDAWEHDSAPDTCGAKGVSQATLDRWKNDSIAIGGVYDYPKTDVEFFDCTNQATAVTAMAQIYESLVAQTEGSAGLVGYHCFSQADGCQGEGLGQGATQAIDSLVAGCKPRH